MRIKKNPEVGMDICFECCVLSDSGADHSSRGVLPTVIRHFVCSRNFKIEEAIARVRHSSTCGTISFGNHYVLSNFSLTMVG